jgi:hypothetical protein
VGWGLSRIGLPDNIGSFVCVCRHLGGAHVIADTRMTESLSNAGVILHARAKYFAFLFVQRIIDTQVLARITKILSLNNKTSSV